MLSFSSLHIHWKCLLLHWTLCLQEAYVLRWQENSESVSVFNECITQKDREREGGRSPWAMCSRVQASAHGWRPYSALSGVCVCMCFMGHFVVSYDAIICNNVCYFMWIIPVSVNTKHLCVAFTPQPSHMYVFFDTVVKGLFLFVAHSHSYARPSDEGDDRCSYPMWCRRCSASRRHRTATRVWRRKCHTLNHTLFLTILIHI